MGNKKIQYILLVLFIISFALGALGYLNRNKKHSSANDANIKSLVYSNKTAEIASLNEKIGGYEFTKGIKRFHYAYINSDINDDNTITYTILSSSFEAEENPHDVSYSFKGINTPVAVHAMVNLSIEGVLVKSYVLDSNSRLYLVTFLAEESKHNGFEITEYKVDNIESFYEFDAPIFDEYNAEDTYVIFKTKDGTYYTDYIFDNTENTITKIVSNEEMIDVNPEEQINEENQTVQQTN